MVESTKKTTTTRKTSAKTTKAASTTTKKTTAKTATTAKKASTKTTTKASTATTAKKTTAAKKAPVKKTTTVKNVETKKVNSVKATKSKKSFIKCLDFIKLNILDLVLLFKNFIHWNFSKIIIFVYSLLLWAVAVLPLVLVFFIYTFFSDNSIWSLLNSLMVWDFVSGLFGNILLFLIIFIYFIAYSYSNILLLNLNNSYLDWKKIEYKKNEYLNYKKIIKFFNLSFVNIWILLVPVLIFAVLMGILFLFSGSIDEIVVLVSSGITNYFSILSLVFLLITSLLFAYLYYRVVFSYLVLAESKKELKVLEYIKTSFEKTKSIKKMFKFLLIVILYLVIISPISYIWEVLENNGKLLSDYSLISQLPEEQIESLTGNNLYYYESLKIEFEGLSPEQIDRKIDLNWAYIILYSIFNFIFLYWLFVMVFSSYYRRELV